MPPSEVSTEDGASEYCLVNAIQKNLAMLLDKIVLNKHVDIARTRVCTLNMDTRHQLGMIKSEINKLAEVSEDEQIILVLNFLMIIFYILFSSRIIRLPVPCLFFLTQLLLAA